MWRNNDRLIPSDQLIPYCSAADVYLFPSFNKHLVTFGGLGTAHIEPLDCGIPVVSTTLKHFMGGWEKIGKIPKMPEDVINYVSEIFDDSFPYKDCREIAKKYYAWDVIIKHITDAYDELLEK